jgi:hypothetical protein
VCAQFDTLHATQKAGRSKKVLMQGKHNTTHTARTNSIIGCLATAAVAHTRPGHANSELQTRLCKYSIQNVFHQSSRRLKGLNQKSVPRAAVGEKGLSRPQWHWRNYSVPTASP